MPELSIIADLVAAFGKGLVHPLKEKVAHILLALLTLVYQWHYGRLSPEAWRENVWEAATPWVWLICALLSWHLVKAARTLDRQVAQGLYRSRKPFIILTDGEQTRVSPHYQLHIWATTALFLLFLASVACLSWQATRKSTDSGTFSVSDGSLAFINMSQSLSSAGSSGWWVTYGSSLGDTASPVALLQYVEITNLLPRPETVRLYSVAIHTEGCGWTYLSPIPMRDVNVWFARDGLDKAVRIDFSRNGIDIVMENPIPAHGTVTGFWVFDSKVKCEVVEGSRVQYRISLSTFDGTKFEYTTPEREVSNKAHDPGNTDMHVTGPMFVVPPDAHADISHLPRKLWSSPIS